MPLIRKYKSSLFAVLEKMTFSFLFWSDDREFATTAAAAAKVAINNLASPSEAASNEEEDGSSTWERGASLDLC